MRRVLTYTFLLGGLGLMVATYFFGAAPWCAEEVACSNPRLEWSSVLFVFGILLAFGSAIVYEVMTDPSDGEIE